MLLSARRFSNVQSSPDGTRLSFYQGGLKLQQADGSERVLYPGSVRGYQWVDDNTLVFAYDRQGNEKWNLALVHADGQPFPSADGKPRPYLKVTDNPGAIHELCFQTPGQIFYRSNQRNDSDYDLYSYDVATQRHKLVHQGDGNLEPLRLLPDGRILMSQVHSNVNNDLLALDPQTGEQQLLTPHRGNVNYTPETFLNDRELLCISNQDREFHTASILDLESGQLQPLFDAKWDVEQMSYQPETGRLACVFNEDGFSRLRMFHLPSRQWLPCPDLPSGVVGQLQWSAPDRLRFGLNSPERPNSFGEFDLQSGQVRWLKEASFPTPVDPNRFVQPELVHFPSADGTIIPGLLYRSPHANPEAPAAAVINLHGGPESQSRPRFDAVVQHLLDQGISVLNPNVRGSAGYGRSFLDADNGIKRFGAVQDVKASADFLRKIGFDPARIGLLGGSYGGYLAQAAMAFAPEENWAAGVSSVGMSNLETFMRNTANWRRSNRAAEYGDPDTESETLRALSPVHAAQNVRAPLLMIQGANDPRVPRSEAEQMVGALRNGGADVEYILLPDEGHSISKPDNAVRVYSRATEFLADKLLKLPSENIG